MGKAKAPNGSPDVYALKAKRYYGPYVDLPSIMTKGRYAHHTVMQTTPTVKITKTDLLIRD